ncbi:MAG TPA: PLP-dependent aminotransferase family protein [Gaiellales bacterium]|nr:PLP-dependent aminotransferase family protein [Gaiellales bacterium]
MDDTSQPIELLVSVDRHGPATLGAQIEDQLRRAIRAGALHTAAQVPSTRDLARQLGISRRVVVDAYAQLAAEGYLTLRRGARPQVAAAPAGEQAEPATAPAPSPPRYDFRPSHPDVSSFPRAGWLRALRGALATMTDAELGYGDPRGVEVLRAGLSDYLGRVRGVVSAPERVLVTCGYSQAHDLICRSLAAAGARRIAFEDPSDDERRLTAQRAGLDIAAIPVDAEGIRVEELARSGADAVIVTPAHQFPTGVVLSAERRTALLAWLREANALAIEDDYDAEYRYDRAAVGALQGLAPERVIYAGSVSKTLAPALRLGWLVLPPAILEPVTYEKHLADMGSSRVDQHAFAGFLARGELDRHLRRMRARYRRRRDALVEALAAELPEATVEGIAAGLHATVRLPGSDDEERILAEAGARRIALGTVARYRVAPGHRPLLLLGYATQPEPTIRAGVTALREAVAAARA